MPMIAWYRLFFFKEGSTPPPRGTTYVYGYGVLPPGCLGAQAHVWPKLAKMMNGGLDQGSLVPESMNGAGGRQRPPMITFALTQGWGDITDRNIP